MRWESTEIEELERDQETKEFLLIADVYKRASPRAKQMFRVLLARHQKEDQETAPDTEGPVLLGRH